MNSTKTSEKRFEYLDGELFSMVGGKIDHREIGANVLHQLHNRLAGRPCCVYGPDDVIQSFLDVQFDVTQLSNKAVGVDVP